MTSGAPLRSPPRPLGLRPRGLGGLLRDTPSVNRKSLYTYSILLIMSQGYWRSNTTGSFEFSLTMIDEIIND